MRSAIIRRTLWSSKVSISSPWIFSRLLDRLSSQKATTAIGSVATRLGRADAFVDEDGPRDQPPSLELGLHEVGLVARGLARILEVDVRLASVDETQATRQIAIAMETDVRFAHSLDHALSMAP
jgi:hypothetical protein